MRKETKTNSSAEQSHGVFTTEGEVQARIISKAALMGSGAAPS